MFYDSNGRAVSDDAAVTQADVSNGTMIVGLDEDALGDAAAELTVKIITSEMHEGSTVQCPAEPALTVNEKETIDAFLDRPVDMLVKLTEGYEFETVSFSVDGGQFITVKQVEGGLQAVVTGLELQHSHIIVKVDIPHPDKVRQPNAIVSITLRVHVNVHEPVGDLVVTKTVAGSQGDKSKDFKFRVTLTAPAAEEGGDNEPETVKYGDVEFTDGVGEFTLRHGQSVSITGIPEKTKYVVEELDADGYTVTKSGDKGEVGLLTKDTAAFTNTKGTVGGSGSGSSGAPDTGDDRHPGLWLGLLALCLGGIAVSVPVLCRRRGTR